MKDLYALFRQSLAGLRLMIAATLSQPPVSRAYRPYTVTIRARGFWPRPPESSVSTITGKPYPMRSLDCRHGMRILGG